ncbi:MAG TPA: hypothetical protein VMT35_12145 [Ignavibacteriaceae bacterium]|nr:hypothetical protein [Ignavibacteriaceae bacterium]
MKTIKFFLTVLIFIIYFYDSFIWAQGKIITSTEANQLFGSVLVSISMSTHEFEQIINQSKNALRVKISSNNLFITNSEKSILYKSGGNLSPDENFHTFSILVIKELIAKGQSNIVFFEQRNDVLTITIGEFTLEFSTCC